VLVVVCALATNYTGKLLIRCCYDEQGKRLCKSYDEVGFRAFGRVGQVVAQLFENATLFGVSALFLILSGKFIEEMAPEEWAITSRHWTLVSAGVVTVPVVALRTIGELWFLPLVGIVAVVVVVIAVLVQATRASIDHTAPPHSHSTVIAEGLIPAFSALSLAFSAHAGLPTVEAAMQDRSQFPTALNLAWSMILLLYLPVAVVGYYVYGDAVYSPGLCSLPREGLVQMGAKALVTVHVLLTYPVLITLFLTEAERFLAIHPGTDLYLAKRTGLRVLTVAATAVVAVGVPYFDTMMSLIGALCIVATTFVMPAAFYLKIYKPPWKECVGPVLIAVLGGFGGLWGVIQASHQLYTKVANHVDPNSG
jgi:amino acid permease